jgi:large subunit ribosomal protein L18
MANGPRYRVPFRRRREGRTDYRQRQRLLRARIPRAVVRLSLKNATVQFINFEPTGDKIVASANSKELNKLGWTAATGNLPAAYLTGYLAGKRAVKSGVTEAVLDIGQKVPTKGASCFAALKGMHDAGIAIPHGAEILPSEDRIKGRHINVDIEKMVQDVKSRLEAE